MNISNLVKKSNVTADYEQVTAFIDKLPLVNSHYIIPIIAVVYLIIVTKLGPKYMKNRNPIKSVKSIIPTYNVLQVIVNALIVVLGITDFEFMKDSYGNVCDTRNEYDVKHKIKFAYLSYMWCLLKVSDLFDTLFFVLLKKDSHVSFLHVYHHSTTMVMAFVVLKYLRTEQAILYAAVNCVVHVIMYSYYFLTSIGFHPKWKKLVTISQLIQFLFLVITTCFILPCQTTPVYKYFSIYSLFQCGMYIYLFSAFFIKSYKIKNQ